MKTITRFELVRDLLARNSSAFPATIVALTKEHNLRAKMDGVPNPFWQAHKDGRLKKRSEVNGFLNWIYANSVNNQRMREEQPLTPDGHIEHFEPLPRAWGHRVKGTPFVRHTNKGGDKLIYLELKVERSLEWRYEIDGEPVDKAEVLPFVAKKKESSRQKTEKAIYCRDYLLSNVLEIRYGGEIYSLATA